RQGIEAPQGSDDRSQGGHETVALKVARQPQEQRVVLPQAAHRHGQPPNQKEQGKVERAVAVQSGGEPAQRRQRPVPYFQSLAQIVLSRPPCFTPPRRGDTGTRVYARNPRRLCPLALSPKPPPPPARRRGTLQG